MIATFDVFRIEADGSVKWFGAFTDIEAAQARIQELLGSSSGKYFIFSQTTGHKLFFNQQRTPNSHQTGNDREVKQRVNEPTPPLPMQGH